MALFLDDLLYNKLYKKKVYLPINTDNRRKGSAIFLLTPDYMSSVRAMSSDHFINNRLFESYYIEKDVNIILNEGGLIDVDEYLGKDVTIVENSLPGLYRHVVTDVSELDSYGIKTDDIPSSFVAYVFTDTNDRCHGYIITQGNMIYKVDSKSYQVKKDLIEFAIDTLKLSTARTTGDKDLQKILKSNGFKFLMGPTEVMIGPMKDKTFFTEASGSNMRLEAEIALWKAQIKITELIIKNFHNDNWMNTQFKSFRNKLAKIPLPGYVRQLDTKLDTFKMELEDQKATLRFMIAIKALDTKEELDISEVTSEYVSWVNALHCPDSLKIKIIDSVIDSYEKTIKECEYNLERYRKLDEAKKRMENGMALVNKVISMFSFLTGGPLGVLKSVVVKAILPKTRKKSVLSEEELETKIKLYRSIVEKLEETKKEIYTNESAENTFISEATYSNDQLYVASVSKEYNGQPLSQLDPDKFLSIGIITAIGFDKNPSTKQETYYIYQPDDSDTLQYKTVGRRVKLQNDTTLRLVGEIKVDYDYYKGKPVDYDWIWHYDVDGKAISNWQESVLLEFGSSSPNEVIKSIPGYISHKQMRDNIYLVQRNRLYDDDKKYHKENWLYILTDDNKVAGEVLLYNKNTEIYSLFTKKKYRGHGYATRLLTCAVNDLGAKLLSVKTSEENDIAHKLYLRLGFKEYNRNKDFIYLRIDGKISETKYMREFSMLTEAGRPYIPMDIIEFNKQLNSWDYGILINGKVVTKDIPFSKYKTLTLAEIERYHAGVCWDYVHYEANWFQKNGYEFDTYFIIIDNDNDCPSHTFLTFYLPETRKHYYFESSWGKYQGIEEFDSIGELLNTVKARHIENYGEKGGKFYTFKYDATSTSLEHLDAMQYMNKVSKGKIKEDQYVIENLLIEDKVNVDLSAYKQIPMNKDTVFKYKVQCKYLSHFRTDKDGPYKGYIWLDDHVVVAACSVDTERGYIQAIEISDGYKGKGLAAEILEKCIKLGGKKLSVSKKNTIAKHVYLKRGFETISSTDTREEMVLNEISRIPSKSADIEGAYCALPTKKSDRKTMDEDCTDRTIEHAINNFLQTEYPDYEDKSTCYIFALDSNNTLHCIGRIKIESDDPITYSWIEKIPTPKDFKMWTETAMLTPINEGVDILLSEGFIQDNDSITYFNTFNEDTIYNKPLRRILYSERIRNRKEILLLHDKIKEDCPFITKTYVDYNRYQKFNLFVDMSYYSQSFFKNNYLKRDKGIDIYFDFINRFLKDKRLDEAGYNKKTVFIPVNDWPREDDSLLWNYQINLNPISVIYRLLYRGDIDRLKEAWGSYDFVFIGDKGYFKMNFSNFEKKYIPRFLANLRVLINKEPIQDEDTPNNSKDGIVADIVDRLEANSRNTIKINNLTGKSKATPEDIKDIEKNAAVKSDSEYEEKEAELVKAIKDVADKSADADEAIEKINNDDDIKQIILDLQSASPSSVNLNPTRVARVNKLNDEFTKKVIKDKKVSELIDNFNDTPLEETKLPIDSVNDEWSHMTYMNFGKQYDLDADIVKCIHHFGSCTIPVAVRDLKVEDTSTSEDFVDTWNIDFEDVYGKRFRMKFDVPKLKNHRFMRLRGNDKTMSNQLMNLPIIKTDLDTCQITSNYNKIFIYRHGESVGKSYVVADRIIKALKKYDGNVIKVKYGDNSKISAKYELPIDYIDLSSVFSEISYHDNRVHADGKHKGCQITFYFNRDNFLEEFGSLIDKKQEDQGYFPVGIADYGNGIRNVLYVDGITTSSYIKTFLDSVDGFRDAYTQTNTSVRYSYSKASILNTDIPVAVIIAYNIGLIPMLDKAGIKYEVFDKRPQYNKDTSDLIKLEDAFILYELTYDSSLLLNGLKECDTANYSIKDVNSKKMWLEALDNFGGRIKADGLDMFYDLMIDPITAIVCDKYKLPDNYIEALLYANMLLSDNKYNRHVDLTGNKFRNNEIIAGYVYKALCNSYTLYRRQLNAGRDATMTIKQSAVIDMILMDPTSSDFSILNPLLEIESANSVSFKGLSGMNSDRAYGLDKRTYSDTMVNILALSTGFAANAGINRQTTIDMNVDTSRGYIKVDKDNMSITKTFCMAEALTPYGSTSDDPFRTAMTFIQTAKHNMRVKQSDPSLITNGADEALPYLTSDTFSYKAKGPGKIKEKTDDYIVLEYKDGKTEVIDLRERMMKNSDGGFYVPLKLDTDYKEGDTFKESDILAYDKESYSPVVGPRDNIAYNIGTFCKFAIISSDAGFEDSCIETEWLSHAMSSTVGVNKSYTFPKTTNVYYMAKKGQSIQEGEPLIIFQNAFSDEDANALVRLLGADEDDDIVSELGRIPIKSKVTGKIADIKIYRCVDKEELSPSLLKIVNEWEREQNKINKVLDKYDADKAKVADATYKLEPTGKLKNARDSVMIEFYLTYEDDFSVGDKTVCYSALKGVSSEKIAEGDEPVSEYRPDEKIHYIQSQIGDLKRMVGSVVKVGALNKVLVELQRHACDIMGVKWKYFDEY